MTDDWLCERFKSQQRAAGFPEGLRSHEDHMKFGVFMGWWHEWDEKGPLKTVWVDPSSQWEVVAVNNGIFESLTQARKNGWSGAAETDRFSKGRRLAFKIRKTENA